MSLLAAEPSEVIEGSSEADWERLRRVLAARQSDAGMDAGVETGFGRVPLGFAAGWVEYDGAFRFGIYDRLLAFRHAAGGSGGEWLAVGAGAAQGADFGSLSQLPQRKPIPARLCFEPMLAEDDFVQKVRRAQEYIAAGDIYQVNLSHRLEADWKGVEAAGGDAFAFYEALRCCSPAPQAAFLSLGGRSVLSSSPELFLEMAGRAIRTRPIKGTRPRAVEPEADDRSARELLGSEKERAELVMITDLERNDLGQVCEFGSVQVSELLKLERYRQVFHLVSTVEGRLRPEVDAVQALRACFPGGSITGAPKKRAMEIIRELEQVPRGLYTGAIGYFGFNGVSQFSIAIRTAVVEQGRVHFHVGAGIVADSDPAAEWRETLHKAAGILLAAQAFSSKI